jgi:hypothetical protein
MTYHSNATRHAASQSYYSTFNSLTRRRLPLEIYNPQKWRASMASRTDLYCPVFFDYPGQARQGVSMRDLRLKGVSTPIQGPNDPVLAHTRLKWIIFRIIVGASSREPSRVELTNCASFLSESVSWIRTRLVVSYNPCHQPHRHPHHTRSPRCADRLELCPLR